MKKNEKKTFNGIISLYESLLQPWYNPLWLTGLKAPTNLLTNQYGLHRYVFPLISFYFIFYNK